MLRTIGIILLMVALILSNGCTRYIVESTKADGSTINVSVWSSRSFEAPDLHYSRDGADKATFDFKAAKVDDGTASMVALFAPLIQGLMTGAIVANPTPTPLAPTSTQ